MASYSDRAFRISRHAIRVHGAIQDETELAHLTQLVLDRQPEVVVEIGTSIGGGFYALAQAAAPTATLYSIDIGVYAGGVYAPPALLQQYAQPDQTVLAIHGNSQWDRTRDTLEYWLDGKPIDLLFIDADHHYDSVRRDHELYSPLVRPGGLVGFHDIQRNSEHQEGCEVDVFWRKIRPQLDQYWEFIYAPQFGIGVYEQSAVKISAPDRRVSEERSEEHTPQVEVRGADWAAMPPEVAEQRARVGSRLARLERKYR